MARYTGPKSKISRKFEGRRGPFLGIGESGLGDTMIDFDERFKAKYGSMYCHEDRSS